MFNFSSSHRLHSPLAIVAFESIQSPFLLFHCNDCEHFLTGLPHDFNDALHAKESHVEAEQKKMNVINEIISPKINNKHH